MKLHRTKYLALAALGAFASPLFVSAAVDSPEKVVDLITKVSGWLYSGLIAIAVIVIIYGAFEMLFSGGDAEKVKRGKMTILFTVIAVAIAILATGIIKIIQQLLGAQ